MKRLAFFLASVFLTAHASGEGITVQSARGEVSVRHGVTESWTPVGAGDLLRLHDSMKTGGSGAAVLSVATASGTKTIALPSEVIVDISDIRDLSQEELMLKLTMEKVRGSGYQWDELDPSIPNAGVIHGTNKGEARELTENKLRTGRMQLNGARVLFENGFFSTCVLRSMEIFRLYPDLSKSFEDRLMVARALEQAKLTGEALSEYGAMAGFEGLTAEQQSLVREQMRALRK
jgi:hypothetical protein